MAALLGHSNGGRRSLGPRHIVSTRMPIPEVEKLHKIVELEGSSVTEYVAKVLREHIASVNIESFDSQEELPLGRTG